jgi:hypothetical protein
VDKTSLIQVLTSCTAKSEQEAQELIALKKQFPYSQALHTIAAKVSKDHAFSFQQSELQMAAVYSTDRAVLKSIMTMDVMISTPVDEPETKETPKRVRAKSNEETAVLEPGLVAKKTDTIPPEKLVVYQQIEKTIDNVDVADVILQDLKRLSQLKHNFEMLFADQSIVNIPVTEQNKTIIENETTVTGEPSKSRREKIIELAKAMGGSENAQPGLTRKKRKDGLPDIIEELTSKEEIAPGSDRLKEQIEIIDQFIKTQPSIVNVRDRNSMPPTDLNSIKSGEFGENIISETLVEILIKQGKKDRAIEVLKKLIWKYPQKKAYFASQIEDLKK